MESDSANRNMIVSLKEVASLFKKERHTILNNWISYQDTQSPKFIYLRKGIEQLIDDFSYYLSNGDLEKYFHSNAQIGKITANADINYDLFIDSFHTFESAYSSILEHHYNGNLSYIIDCLDHIHHKTISILAKEYFNIKDATIFALAKLTESRDPETGEHIERTREYSKVIAEALGCDRDFVQNIYDTAPLHDIGKIGIPDKILLKPAPLTPEEFALMKTHTQIGGDTLNSVIGNMEITRGYLVMARDIAYYHHEKYDGSGYNGLIGEDIPLSARIFTICDVYDALTSKRPYKDAFSHELAYSLILNPSDRSKPEHFDPSVLKVFNESNSMFKDINEFYKKK